MHTRWEKRKNERERLERKEEKRKETAGGWMENKREREGWRDREIEHKHLPSRLPAQLKTTQETFHICLLQPAKAISLPLIILEIL